ncbi:uncharacterized protein TNCV_2090361 [Trichonephila clavipes]|nr:uncharacterized protein TNCV_2090361 [Trichonephila clavipes]
MTRDPSHEFRNATPSANNQFTNRSRQENWRDNRVNNRYSDNSRPQRESNRFGGQGVCDNRRFDSRRRSDQSDHRFNNHGGRQGGLVELQIRIRDFQKTWEFHILDNMQYQWILGINFIKDSRLTLDFDKKSLVIPDDQIKLLPIVEKPVEIDLSNTKLEQPGLTHVLYHELDTGDQGPVCQDPIAMIESNRR